MIEVSLGNLRSELVVLRKVWDDHLDRNSSAVGVLDFTHANIVDYIRREICIQLCGINLLTGIKFIRALDCRRCVDHDRRCASRLAIPMRCPKTVSEGNFEIYLLAAMISWVNPLLTARQSFDEELHPSAVGFSTQSCRNGRYDSAIRGLRHVDRVTRSDALASVDRKNRESSLSLSLATDSTEPQLATLPKLSGVRVPALDGSSALEDIRCGISVEIGGFLSFSSLMKAITWLHWS